MLWANILWLTHVLRLLISFVLALTRKRDMSALHGLDDYDYEKVAPDSNEHNAVILLRSGQSHANWLWLIYGKEARVH